MEGLISAWTLNGKGGGTEIPDFSVDRLSGAGDVVWVHLDRNYEESCRSVFRAIALDPIIEQALMAEETAPRHVVAPDGLVVILRGVNTNPESDPEDMVSIRVWIDERHIISMRHRRIASIADIRDRLAQGIGPKSPGDFVATLADRLVERMGPVIHGLRERVDTLEDNVEGTDRLEARAKLRDIRRESTMLRRYLAPQSEVLEQLPKEEVKLLPKAARQRLMETAQHTQRYVAELDSVRERAAIVQDEIITLGAEAVNSTMFVLTLMATVLLPLGVLTGMLGMNVGGMPLADNPNGFWIVTGGLFAVSALGLLLAFWIKSRR